MGSVLHWVTFKSAAYAPKDGTAEFGGAGSDQLADNRKAIVYYPEYWQGKDGVGYGNVIVRGDYTQSPVYYDWVISDTGGATGEDLSGLPDSKVIGEVGSAHKNYEKFDKNKNSSEQSGT